MRLLVVFITLCALLGGGAGCIVHDHGHDHDHWDHDHWVHDDHWDHH